MSDKLRLPGLLAICGLFILAEPALGQQMNPLGAVPRPHQAAKKPGTIVLCLPPGGSAPRPCPSAAAGSTVQLDTNLTGSAPLPVTLIDVSGGIRARVMAMPVPGRDGSYRITVPRHLCSKERLGNFQIQIATSDMNQAESKSGDADSIGYFQMRCGG